MNHESASVDLSRYTTGDYDPGPLWLRAIWYFVSVIFFETAFPWPSRLKAAILRGFGAKVGEGAVLKPRLQIKYPWALEMGDHVWLGDGVSLDNVARMRIGSHVCLSQGATLLTGNHDRTLPGFDLRLAPIEIADGAWIGARALLCPGTRMESHAVLNAGSVGKGTLEAHGIYEGNPATRVGTRKITENP